MKITVNAPYNKDITIDNGVVKIGESIIITKNRPDANIELIINNEEIAINITADGVKAVKKAEGIKNRRKKVPYCEYLPYVREALSKQFEATTTDIARYVSEKVGKKVPPSTIYHLYYYVFREISRRDDIVSKLASNSELINRVREAIKQGKKTGTEIEKDLGINKRTILDLIHGSAKEAIVKHYDDEGFLVSDG